MERSTGRSQDKTCWNLKNIPLLRILKDTSFRPAEPQSSTGEMMKKSKNSKKYIVW